MILEITIENLVIRKNDHFNSSYEKHHALKFLQKKARFICVLPKKAHFEHYDEKSTFQAE